MKLISDYILSILPFDIQDSIQYLKGGIKSINKSSFYSLPSFLADEKDITNVNDSGSLLSIIGLIILGGGVVLVVILTGDYIAPATMWWIPGMETILDQLYSTGNYILSWFQSPQIDNSPKISPTSPRCDLPPSSPSLWDPCGDRIEGRDDSISRSFSDSSGSTGSSGSTAQPLTPNPSRPVTPTIWLSRTNPADPNNEPWN